MHWSWLCVLCSSASTTFRSSHLNLLQSAMLQSSCETLSAHLTLLVADYVQSMVCAAVDWPSGAGQAYHVSRWNALISVSAMSSSFHNNISSTLPSVTQTCHSLLQSAAKLSSRLRRCLLQHSVSYHVCCAVRQYPSALQQSTGFCEIWKSSKCDSSALLLNACTVTPTNECIGISAANRTAT